MGMVALALFSLYFNLTQCNEQCRVCATLLVRYSLVCVMSDYVRQDSKTGQVANGIREGVLLVARAASGR